MAPVVWLALGLACFSPDDQRPGLHLSGPVAEVPDDWAFADAHREIALQVSTPHWLPHSVTIWCVSDGGGLYVAARNPEEKRWPAWADRDPEVRLRIDGTVYEVRLEPLDDADAIARVRAAYARKYELPEVAEGQAPPMRYWRVLSRG